MTKSRSKTSASGAKTKRKSLAVVKTSSTTLSFAGALMRGRLMPLTIVFATMLLGIKIADIVRGTNELSEMFLASNAQAISPEEEAAAKAKEESDKAKADGEKADAKASDAKPEESKTEEAKPEESKAAEGDKPKEGDAEKKPEDAKAAEGEAAKEGDKPAEGGDKPAEEKTAEGEKSVDSSKEGEKPAEGEAAKEGEKKAEKEESKKPEKPKKPEFSQVEVDILQSLSARREELAKWEEDVRTKERLLEATEVRLDKKIEQTKTLETTVKGLLEQYNKHEDEKINSLVKIYENMKPVDAARIFDELEMPILVMVVDKMKERKVAPILANMTPNRAKQLTMELAEDRKLRESVDDTLNPAAK
jgi:flagellar motility protein MotE (MotC chaperone)